MDTQDQELSFLERLPEEILHESVVNLKLNDIFHLCLTNRNLNKILCGNNIFWKRKYLHHFLMPEKRIIDWEKAFMDVVVKRHCKEYIYPYEKLKKKYPDRFDTPEKNKGININISDILLQYYNKINKNLEKGDLFFPDTYDIYRNNDLLIYDGKGIRELEFDPDDYGNLPYYLKILEEPDYFPPQYWHNIDVEKDPTWRGINHNYIINFDHIPYKKELTTNIKFVGDNTVYTSFVDIRGVSRNIFYFYENLDFDPKQILTDSDKEIIKKEFKKLLENRKLYFEAYDQDYLNTNIFRPGYDFVLTQRYLSD